ncbi:MAG TPA: DNA-binding protein, partial [Rhodanobacteraceae bacterium]|nr:DNA-binding protein [Rhodanobacteraceae bacterium]
MSSVLVDANVLLDVLTEDPKWSDWSAGQLDACAANSEMCINPIIYAEVSVGFERIEELDKALTPD